MKSPNLRIAIVRLSALGDIVNTAVVLQIIHCYYPDAHIDWFVEEAFAPILHNHPLIHEVIPVPLKRLKKNKNFALLKEMIHTLKSRERYDHIIDAQGLLKSAIVASFLPGNVHGFDRKSAREGIASWFYSTTSSIPYEISVIQRNVMVITEALNIPYSDSLIEKKTPVFDSPSASYENKIALVIGASWQSKCYPKEQFALLCDLLPYPCHLVWGSAREYEDAVWIQEHSKNASITPKMSLKELVDFMAYCTLTIGNDTGPTHIAWAMNVPSITLFGPTNERMIYPTSINIGIKSPSEVDIFHINRNDFSINQIDPHLIATKAKGLL
ncbi:MAG: lipopolysaccharide heptosyltransferase I [Sulfuricurvum sp.]|nr:lipopolysaccharide heptosyltransferase I [Sulfuricurvum sp.]MDD5386749.1 lipopolysaccharide heptosyltransferase I [Sulfuricurvum sp.]